MSVIYKPGDCESFGDISRKLAAAHGRRWEYLTMGEWEAWHRYTGRLLGMLLEQWRGHPC